MSYTRWHAIWMDEPNLTTPANAGFLQHIEDTFVSQDTRITTLETSGGGGTGAVTSVAGRTGVVTLAKADVGLNNVDNTSDVNKPVSTLQTTAINTGDALAIPKTLVTAKGNLIVATASGTPTNLAVGADTQVLTADSTQATGTKWATPTGGGSGIPASTATTKGDLLAATASATVTRLGIGTDGQVLTAQSSQSTGLNWITPTPAPISSVAGRTGTIVLAHGDITGDAIILSDYGAKGSILTKTTSGTRASVSVGTDGQILTANSSSAGGFNWSPPTGYNQVQDEGTNLFQEQIINFVGTGVTATDDGISKTIVTIPGAPVTSVAGRTGTVVLASTDITGTALIHTLATTKADLLAASSSANITRLGVGSDSQVLTADSTQTVGLKWATPVFITNPNFSTYPNVNNYYGWTLDPLQADGTSTLTAGTVYIGKILIVDNPKTLTTISIFVSTAATGVTASQNQLGIYDAGGTLLNQASIDSIITSTGIKNVTISSSSVTTAFCYVGIVFNATGALALQSKATVVTTLFNSGLTASNYRFAKNGTGQTSLPTNLTLSSNSLIGCLPFWAGVV